MVVGDRTGKRTIADRVQVEGRPQLPQRRVDVAGAQQLVATLRSRHGTGKPLTFQKTVERKSGGIVEESQQVQQQRQREADENDGEQGAQHVFRRRCRSRTAR